MWTETTQQQYRRDGLRYASDVTDTEWAFANDSTYAPDSTEIANIILGAIAYCHMENMVAGKQYPTRTMEAANKCMNGQGAKMGYAVMRGLRGNP